MTVSKHNERCVRKTDLQVGEPIDQLDSRLQIACTEWLKLVHTAGDLLQQCSLRVHTDVLREEIVEFCKNERREQERRMRSP